MKTLYISDLDGTLLQQNVELSGQTISILNELIQQGMLFSIATARSIASVKPIFKEVVLPMPIVLMNGVCIYDLAQNQYINIETLSSKSKNMLLSILKEYGLKGFVYTIKNGVMETYYDKLNTKVLHDFYQERVDKYKKRFTQVNDFCELAEEPIIYFSIMDEKSRLEPLYHIILNSPELNCVFYQDTYSAGLWYLEIFSQNASKYHAVQYLREHYQLDSIVCFGDNLNDLPLFDACDHKIAVSNAVSELKNKADEIIRSNWDDGVVLWLKDNFFPTP